MGTLVKVDGATILDTDTGVYLCNLGDIVWQANQPTTTTLDIPVTDATTCGRFVNTDLTGKTGVVVEVTIDGTMLPRFILTGVQPTGDKSAVRVSLADRRYDPRYVGRTGYPANLTPDFYDATPGTIPPGWTLNAGAPDTNTITPSASPGVFGYNVMEITATGPGPGNCYSAGYTLGTVAYDRNVGMGAWVYLPSGSWTPNTEQRLMQLVAYDTSTGLAVDSVVAGLDVSDTWTILTGSVRVPAGKTYSIELRLFAPNGTVRFEQPGFIAQEALSWVNADIGQIIRDLVAHASDATWGHSDTHLRATTTSVPDTGLSLSRTIRSSEKHKVADAVTEMCNTAQVWQAVTPQIDGTDLLSTFTGGVCTVTASDTNADLGEWQWQGNDHAGVLGMFAPDNIDVTGDRLIMWASSSGVLGAQGVAWDLGRELYMAGPFGNYDPRIVSGLLVPFYNAKAAALAIPLHFRDDAAVHGELLTGNLRPGGLLNATVGSWPVGIDGQYRIVGVTLHGDSFAVSVDLNRVPA